MVDSQGVAMRFVERDPKQLAGAFDSYSDFGFCFSDFASSRH